MPILSSSFQPPWYLRSAHVQSIVPAICRRIPLPAYRRERLELPDGDFLDLDWLTGGNSRLAIVSHGLEGSSYSGYVRGIASTLFSRGWDVLAWNMRGCSGTPNRLLSWYHSGKSEDLRTVVEHSLNQRPATPLALIGFSVGGNITLKYLGESGSAVPANVRTAVTVSVPVDLASAARELARMRNRVYMEYLLRPLRRRMMEKARSFPGKLDLAGLSKIKSFREFDARYTAPLHGFASVNDYWAKASSAPLLGSITIPTLLVSARNDPFLAPECYPVEAAHKSNLLHLETPVSGGHVGFMSSRSLRATWAESRIVQFLNQFDWSGSS